MNYKSPLQNVLVAVVLISLCSCAGPSKNLGASAPPAKKPSAGAQVGKGVVMGLRFVVGVPVFFMMLIAVPMGGGSPAAAFSLFGGLFEDLPDSPPPATEAPYPTPRHTPNFHRKDDLE